MSLPAPVVTIGLLVASNLFMTPAWYGHLRHTGSPLWMAILASWGIAFIEYCLQVPANRIGYGQLTAAQLRTIQEVIALTVFAAFAALYLGEPLRRDVLVSFGFVTVGAAFAFAPLGGR